MRALHLSAFVSPPDDLSGLKADSGLASEETTEDHHHHHDKAETERPSTGQDGDEQQLDELRAQVPQLLLELDRARETSGKHRRGFLELQGENRPPRSDPPGGALWLYRRPSTRAPSRSHTFGGGGEIP